MIRHLDLICETLDSGRKWLVDLNAEKTQLVSFDWSNNTGAIDVFEEKSSFKRLGLTFSCFLNKSIFFFIP